MPRKRVPRGKLTGNAQNQLENWIALWQERQPEDESSETLLAAEIRMEKNVFGKIRKGEATIDMCRDAWTRLQVANEDINNVIPFTPKEHWEESVSLPNDFNLGLRIDFSRENFIYTNIRRSSSDRNKSATHCAGKLRDGAYRSLILGGPTNRGKTFAAFHIKEILRGAVPAANNVDCIDPVGLHFWLDIVTQSTNVDTLLALFKQGFDAVICPEVEFEDFKRDLKKIFNQDGNHDVVPACDAFFKSQKRSVYFYLDDARNAIDQQNSDNQLQWLVPGFKSFLQYLRTRFPKGQGGTRVIVTTRSHMAQFENEFGELDPKSCRGIGLDPIESADRVAFLRDRLREVDALNTIQQQLQTRQACWQTIDSQTWKRDYPYFARLSNASLKSVTLEAFQASCKVVGDFDSLLQESVEYVEEPGYLALVQEYLEACFSHEQTNKTEKALDYLLMLRCLQHRQSSERNEVVASVVNFLPLMRLQNEMLRRSYNRGGTPGMTAAEWRSLKAITVLWDVRFPFRPAHDPEHESSNSLYPSPELVRKVASYRTNLRSEHFKAVVKGLEDLQLLVAEDPKLPASKRQIRFRDDLFNEVFYEAPSPVDSKRWADYDYASASKHPLASMHRSVARFLGDDAFKIWHRLWADFWELDYTNHDEFRSKMHSILAEVNRLSAQCKSSSAVTQGEDVGEKEIDAFTILRAITKEMGGAPDDSNQPGALENTADSLDITQRLRTKKLRECQDVIRDAPLLWAELKLLHAEITYRMQQNDYAHARLGAHEVVTRLNDLEVKEQKSQHLALLLQARLIVNQIKFEDYDYKERTELITIVKEDVIDVLDNQPDLPKELRASAFTAYGVFLNRAGDFADAIHYYDKGAREILALIEQAEKNALASPNQEQREALLVVAKDLVQDLLRVLVNCSRSVFLEKGSEAAKEFLESVFKSPKDADSKDVNIPIINLAIGREVHSRLAKIGKEPAEPMFGNHTWAYAEMANSADESTLEKTLTQRLHPFFRLSTEARRDKGLNCYLEAPFRSSADKWIHPQFYSLLGATRLYQLRYQEPETSDFVQHLGSAKEYFEKAKAGYVYNGDQVFLSYNLCVLKLYAATKGNIESLNTEEDSKNMVKDFIAGVMTGKIDGQRLTTRDTALWKELDQKGTPPALFALSQFLRSKSDISFQLEVLYALAAAKEGIFGKRGSFNTYIMSLEDLPEEARKALQRKEIYAEEVLNGAIRYEPIFQQTVPVVVRKLVEQCDITAPIFPNSPVIRERVMFAMDQVTMKTHERFGGLMGNGSVKGIPVLQRGSLLMRVSLDANVSENR